MACLSYHSSIPKALVLSSLSNKNHNSPPKPNNINHNPTLPTITSPPTLPTNNHKRSRSRQRPQPPQPSIIQIERAIGASTFSDTDPRELDQRKTVFNGILPDFAGQFEGPVEKKLRETGEWITSRTEGEFRSSGKRILLVSFQWVLPIWTLLLLVACGVIKLPFSAPFLDNLIM